MVVQNNLERESSPSSSPLLGKKKLAARSSSAEIIKLC
jgi:hypothetical protein